MNIKAKIARAIKREENLIRDTLSLEEKEMFERAYLQGRTEALAETNKILEANLKRGKTK